MTTPSPAEARLRHLRVLQILSGAVDVHLELTGDITLRADSVRATNAHLSELIVDNLHTPLGTLPHASLRGDNIVAIEAFISHNDGVSAGAPSPPAAHKAGETSEAMPARVE